MPKNSNLDSLKSREQDAFHRKQVEFKNYLDAKNRADIAYNAMQSARQECRTAREEMNREYEDMQRSSNNFREVWDEYGRIRDINNSRIESLRQEAEYEHREMQDCFERASSCYHYGDKSEAPYWSSQGQDHKCRRDNINEEVSRLCQEVKSARRDAEWRAPKTDSSAFQRAKGFFNDAKSRQKSAEAEFERLKIEREQYKAKFDSIQAEYLRLKEEFQEKLAQIKQDNQRERDKILDKAGVNWSNREDAKIVKKADGTTQVYYGGLLFGDGLGHGHAALDQFDNKTYNRGAFEKHGSQNYVNNSSKESKTYSRNVLEERESQKFIKNTHDCDTTDKYKTRNYHANSDGSWTFDWEGKIAKGYPNKKDPNHFTDILYDGLHGNIKGDKHGHIIIENSTSDVVLHRNVDGEIITLDESRCPGINEKKKQ